jgi:glucokinase
MIYNIKNNNRKRNHIISVIGPGTGLGVANLVPAPYTDSSRSWRFYVWPGEGGHATFASSDALH